VVVVVVVVGATVVVVAAGTAIRRQVRRFAVAAHLNRPADVLRIWPTFLHAVPPIDDGCDALNDTAFALGFEVSGAAAVIGRMPVSAAAPTEIV